MSTWVAALPPATGRVIAPGQLRRSNCMSDLSALPLIATECCTAGLPALSHSGSYGLFAPKGTPNDTIGKLNAAVVEALVDRAVRSRFAEFGYEIFPRGRHLVPACAPRGAGGATGQRAKAHIGFSLKLTVVRRITGRSKRKGPLRSLMLGRSPFGFARSKITEENRSAMPTTEKRALCRLPSTASRRPSARILIVDNHDDFGGRARRNKFELRFPLGAGLSITSDNDDRAASGLAFSPSIRILLYTHCYVTASTPEPEGGARCVSSAAGGAGNSSPLVRCKLHTK
jgi:hypothetical protein